MAVGEQAAAVVEHHDPVAEQAPVLLRVGADRDGGGAGWVLRGGTGRLVLAGNGHGLARGGWVVRLIRTRQSSLRAGAGRNQATTYSGTYVAR